METALKKQLDNLNRSVQEFTRCVKLLPDSLFHKKMNDWTPRDVTAHLIGWNLYTIKGCLQLTKGELPFYFVDPGDDFRKINALSVKRYISKDKQTLLSQLNDSLEKLKEFLLNVDNGSWEKDFGVKYEGGTVTIKNTVDALVFDYVMHRQQIEKWAAK